MNNSMENGMAMLKEKQDREDQANLGTSTALKEHMKEGQEANLQMLIINLSSLYDNFIQDNYSSLDNLFLSIKGKIKEIGDEQFESLIQDKLNLIEIGLKDREVTKYNTATKSVKEIKELLQQIQ